MAKHSIVAPVIPLHIVITSPPHNNSPVSGVNLQVQGNCYNGNNAVTLDAWILCDDGSKILLPPSTNDLSSMTNWTLTFPAVQPSTSGSPHHLFVRARMTTAGGPQRAGDSTLLNVS
jgi:hypothetical protein